MLTLLLFFFLVVMLAGAGLAVLERRGRMLPLKISGVHGVLGAAALVFLVMQAVDHPDNRLVNSAILVFVLAALGGLLLFAFRASRQRLPLGVVLLHGAFALTGFALLLGGWLRGGA